MELLNWLCKVLTLVNQAGTNKHINFLLFVFRPTFQKEYYLDRSVANITSSKTSSFANMTKKYVYRYHSAIQLGNTAR
jgi:hypothetical protein